MDARANIKHEQSGHSRSLREVQSTLDRFFTSLAKRQRPATEEEENYLELTLKIWKKNNKNIVYIFSV